MNATITAPAPMSPADARITLTRLATIGLHPVTGQVQDMYFTSPAELESHLDQRDNRDTNTVFELDTVTGEWVERNGMTPAVAAEVARLGLYRPEPCLMCGGLFELPTMTEVKRRRVRKIDGHACSDCAPESLRLAAR